LALGLPIQDVSPQASFQRAPARPLQKIRSLTFSRSSSTPDARADGDSPIAKVQAEYGRLRAQRARSIEDGAALLAYSALCAYDRRLASGDHHDQ